MLIDAGDPVLNIALNGCFFAITLLTLIAIVPWRVLGAARFSRLLHWLFLPVLVLAVTYELLMPIRFDIRIDLFLLIPMYAIVAVTCLYRKLTDRKHRRAKQQLPG